MEEDPNAIDVNDDPPAKTVYVYRGRETKPKVDEMVTFILAGGFGVEDVKFIEDSSDAKMRKALWDEDCRAVIFPPMHDIPGLPPPSLLLSLPNIVSLDLDLSRLLPARPLP